MTLDSGLPTELFEVHLRLVNIINVRYVLARAELFCKSSFDSVDFYLTICNQSNAWDAWRWRKYMLLAIHDGADKADLSQRQDAAAGTQTAEHL